MSDENKIIGVGKADPAVIKKQEDELKKAYKESRYSDVKRISDAIRAIDPQNHIAVRISEKAEKDLAEQIKKSNSQRIKDLESQVKSAYKNGILMEVGKIAGEIRKLDASNKVIKDIENRIEKDKAMFDASVKKEKRSAFEVQIKELMKEDRTEEYISMANELLAFDSGNSVAMKALKKAADAKKTDVKNLVDVKADQVVKKSDKPVEKPALEKKKSGFFSSLFGKKDQSEKSDKPTAVKEAVKPSVKQAQKAEPVIFAKPEVKVNASVQENKKEENKAGFFSGLFAKKESDKAAEKTAISKESVNIINKKEDAVIVKASDKTVAQPADKAGMLKNLLKGMSQTAPSIAKPSVDVQQEPKKPVEEKVSLAEKKVEAPVTQIVAPKASQPAVSQIKPSSEISVMQTAPVKPAVSIPPKPPVTAFKPVISAPEVSPVKQAAEIKQPVSGNIFTKLFGKTEDTAGSQHNSIIDTIVSQASKDRKDSLLSSKDINDNGEDLVRFAKLFVQFSFAFIIVATGFFYIFNIDSGNTVLSVFGVENNAIQLKNAAEKVGVKEKEKTGLEKDIEKYKKGYENEYKATIDKIVLNRMDWPKLIKDLNEVTESVYEKNALSKYVQYNNYSYDAATGKLTVGATLSDPLGKNLTKLAELEEAFSYYPKDKNDPNDTRTPYFYNLQEFRSYDKSFNKATGRFVSNFTLTLSTKKEVKKK